MRNLSKCSVIGLFCLLIGCQPKVTVQVLANGKLMMYVPKGTTVNWVDENYQPVQVSFPFANPCQEKAASTSTCVVAQGQAIYECDRGLCQDPGVGVKPTTGKTPTYVLKPLVPEGTAKLYQVYCDSNSNNATADGPEVHQNDLVVWVPSIANQSFTLSGFQPAGACNPDTITNGIVCTVGTSSDATYKVQYDACTGNKTGTGKLHVTARR